MKNWFTHPDSVVEGNRIIRHYQSDGTFTDLTVDQTIALKLNQWRGWVCTAGLSQLYIGHDGKVYRGVCREGESIGNVFRGFTTPSEAIVCQAQFCGCGSDVMVPKAQNAESLNQLKNYNNERPRGPSRRRSSIDESERPVAVETAFRVQGVRVQWDIGKRCNYSCSYCWPNVHSSTEPLRTEKELRDAAQRIFDAFSRGRPVFFQFSGGEPTLVPGFLEFVADLKKQGHQVVVTTNGSRTAEYLTQLIDHANINISIHFEFADLEKTVRKIEALVKRRQENRLAGGLEIKIMTPPTFVDNAKVFRDRLLNIPDFEKWANWSFAPIRSNSVDRAESAQLRTYEADELKTIQDRA